MSKIRFSQPAMVLQMRAANLAAYVDIARTLGLDPYASLRRAKIRPDELADPETMLAAGAVVNLLEETAQLSGCQTLGLQLIETQIFTSLGPISLLLEHRMSLGEAIASMMKYQRIVSDIIDIDLADDGETAVLSLEVLPGFGERQLIESEVAVMYRTLRAVTGNLWNSECIHFRHSEPADLRVHRRFFQCPVQFNSEFDGISCASTSLETANPAGNEVMARHAERFVKLLVSQRPACSFSGHVRHAISTLLNRCNVTMERVAQHLGLHPRMLQRSLEKEGATFAALLNETRRELAIRYLASSNRSITEVALLVGYSSISTFSRWFALELGISPAAWRNMKCDEAIYRHYPSAEYNERIAA